MNKTTEKEFELINTIQIDIGVAADKAHSIIRSVINNYFDKSSESFKKDELSQAWLITSYEDISNILNAVDDYIFEVKKIIDTID